MTSYDLTVSIKIGTWKPCNVTNISDAYAYKIMSSVLCIAVGYVTLKNRKTPEGRWLGSVDLREIWEAFSK